MSRSGRWTVLGAVVIAVLVAAFLYQVRDMAPEPQNRPASSGQETLARQSSESLAGPRNEAKLPPCPVQAGSPEKSKLRGVQVECAADGTTVDAAQVVGDGRTVVMNLWAYWCKPCADELPAMAEYQRNSGDQVLVVTVHQDENQGAALQRLTELGVRLPTLQDGQRRIAAALGVPNVMPATVVFRLDGSVAKIIPQAFTSADEIAAAVSKALQ